ncbi:DNA replication and repair protein RecF [Flaviaesturariibacter aridisoli]|uniref:DNA replication and repair protein RecF n=1 Tax=Flaviaesturariibacter aridisoli TaxID=2545761 RepID=A0A4R4E3Y1_9BACT|nr:DNA replication and repair protein RecF [Flaviaesturariibacter aridisoli]
MFVSDISLFQFKNYFHQEFRFTERIVGICGRNGRGKTNLLDALHYLCFTRSYFTRLDQNVPQHGHQGFRLEGRFRLNGREEKAVCVLRETGRKEFSVNDQAYSRFSQHIGRYPCVVIAPDDVQLIIGGSEDRRKFLDTLLSQLDSAYLQHLIAYNKILQQRNSFLKNYGDGPSRDLSVLDVLDEQLLAEGNPLFSRRERFLIGFLADVKHLYNEIAQNYEPLQLLYDSELLSSEFAELLRFNRPKDLVIQRTASGIHRDDLQFLMGTQPFKAIASQGQRKSLLFALKLAELDVLKAEKHLTPLLLLDDVFEKLDEERIGNLLNRVSSDEDAQIFITDTNCGRLTKQLEALKQPFQIIEL